MEKYKVSVIVPVYNSEQYLKKCLDSLIKQSYKNIEIILVDDGSTDTSGMICDDYVKENEKLFVIHKKNEGVSSARNVALDIISGDYCCFVDSDDYVEPDYVKNMVSLIVEPEEYVIKTGFVHEKANGDLVDNNETENAGVFVCNESFDISNKYDYSTVWGKLFSTKHINGNCEKIRFNQSIHYGEDYLFTVQMILLSNGIVISSQKLYHCVFHDGSAIQSFNQKRFTEIAALEEIRELIISFPKSLAFIEYQLAYRAYTIFSLSLRHPKVLSANQNKKLIQTMKTYRKNYLRSDNPNKLKIAYLMASYFPTVFRRFFY